MSLARKKVEFSEREIENFLKSRKEAIGLEASKTAETLGQSRARMGESTAGLAKQFGDEASRLATQQFEPIKTELGIRTGEGLELQKIRQRRQFFNTNYNYAFNRFLQANFDKNKAQEEAMNYALSEDARQFESGQAEIGRKNTLEKEGLVDKYSTLIAQDKQRAMEEAKERAFKNSLIQTLIGLGITVGGGAIVRGIGAGAMALKSANQSNSIPVNRIEI